MLASSFSPSSGSGSAQSSFGSEAHVRKAIGFWVASAAICGGGAVIQYLVGDVIPNASIAGGRATGFAQQPNDLGGITAIAFVPALMLASRPGASLVARGWSYAALLLIAAGMVLSASVGALLAAAAAVVVWLALQRTSIHILLALAVLALTLVVVSALGGPQPLARLGSVTDSTYLAGAGTQLGSAEQRIGTYRAAIARIEENPFVGVGLDLRSITRPFGIESFEYDVHNLVIGLWYKTGLLGLTGILLALLAIFRSGWAAILGSRSAGESRVAIALGCSLAGFVVFSMTAPILFTRFGWIASALVLALRSRAARSGKPRCRRVLRERHPGRPRLPRSRNGAPVGSGASPEDRGTPQPSGTLTPRRRSTAPDPPRQRDPTSARKSRRTSSRARPPA